LAQINLFEDQIQIVTTLPKKHYKFFSFGDPVMDNGIYKFTFI